MRFFRPMGVLSVSVACAACCLTTPALAGDSTEESPSQSAAESSDPPRDPFLVPEGTPEELLKYIDGLAHQRPTAASREVQMEFFKKRSQAVLQAAEKALASKPNAKQSKAAGMFKIQSLVMLDQLGDAQAGKALAVFERELEKKGPHELLSEVQVARLHLRVQHAQDLKKQEFAQLVADIDQRAASMTADPRMAGLMLSAASVAEERCDADGASKVYAAFGKTLSASSDEKIADLGETMKHAVRRLQLPGKTMRVEGTTMDGSALDWKKYRGKVVLVDFWATWCGPCREELKTIQKQYDAYHKRGFEVIGVSIDEDREALEQFLDENHHPWTVVHDASDDPAKSMHAYYGIMGIPTTILVGSDGKVVALNVRGPGLGKALAKLLGPAPSDDATERDKPAAD